MTISASNITSNVDFLFQINFYFLNNYFLKEGCLQMVKLISLNLNKYSIILDFPY